jgi:hypothetical protein
MSPQMSTTVWSTTHTSPITFDRIAPGLIQITLEDGSTQIYPQADLEAACKHESQQEPK